MSDIKAFSSTPMPLTGYFLFFCASEIITVQVIRWDTIHEITARHTALTTADVQSVDL